MRAPTKFAPFTRGTNKPSPTWPWERRKRPASHPRSVLCRDPGFLNAATALATAYSTSSKVVALLGQINLAAIDRGYGLLHEVRDQIGILRTMTKWAERIESPGDAARLTQEAFRQLGAGRPRPVGLECPMDVWGRKAPVTLPGGPAEDEVLPVDTDKVEEAAKLLGLPRTR